MIIFISIVYEKSYSQAVGLDILYIMSTVELAKTCLQWLAIVIIVAIVIPAIIYTPDKDQSENINILDQRDHPFEISGRSFYIYFGSICLTYFISLSFYLPFLIFLIEFSAVYLFVAVNSFLEKKLVGKLSSFRALSVFISAFLTMLLVSTLDGQRQGIADMNKAAPISKLIAADQAPEDVIVYRLMEKGVLFRKINDHSTSFVPWDNLKLLETTDISPKGIPAVEYICTSILQGLKTVANFIWYFYEKIGNLIWKMYGKISGLVGRSYDK